tara:strand:- start:143 stop:376 length:234 start_codon:yes stop_codon:yes gene_type:complete
LEIYKINQLNKIKKSFKNAYTIINKNENFENDTTVDENDTTVENTTVDENESNGVEVFLLENETDNEEIINRPVNNF